MNSAVDLHKTVGRGLGAKRQARLLPSHGFPLDLSALTFSERISHTPESRLRVVTHTDQLNTQAMLGKLYTVEFDVDEGQQRYFTGYADTVTYIGHQGTNIEYGLTLVPFLSLLKHTKDCRIFQHQNVPDIVKALCEQHGYSNVALRLNGQYKAWDYCVQYNETTYAFINRLLEQEGIHYYFEHDKDGHTLVLADHPGAHADILGKKDIPYRESPVHRDFEEDRAFFQWQHQRRIQSGVSTTDDYDNSNPRLELGTTVRHSDRYDYSGFETYEYPGEHVTLREGQNVATTQQQSFQAQHLQESGSSNIPTLQAGSVFNLLDHQREDENVEYLILSVNHEIRMDEYRSGGVTTFSYSNHATALNHTVPYVPLRTTVKPVISGVQSAVVTGPAGEEIWTDHLGRVIVQFHWDRLGQNDENSSCWVPVSQNWAGKRWGAQFLPRIGDEVLVSFIDGDLDRPVITGRLYNGVNKPIYELPANQTQSGIRTNSTKGGDVETYNELRFEDRKGEELITLHAEKDQLIEVENDERHDVGHDRFKSIVQDETVTVGRHRTETVGENETITVGTDRVEEVGQNERLTVGKDQVEHVGKDRSVNVGQHDSLEVGKTLHINVGEEIVLKTGSASITMTSDGKIHIKGSDIFTTASGATTVKSGGNITLKGAKISQN